IILESSVFLGPVSRSGVYERIVTKPNSKGTSVREKYRLALCRNFSASNCATWRIIGAPSYMTMRNDAIGHTTWTPWFQLKACKFES
ncbi:hypothetical protein HAX54_036574, partial [Datura stramonium]|nr:hypothetical protein [Datura stramonium]